MITSNSNSNIIVKKNNDIDSKAMSLSVSTPNLNNGIITSPIKSSSPYKPIHYSSGTRLLGITTSTLPPEKRMQISNPPTSEHKSNKFWGDDDIESTLVLKEAQMLYERSQIKERNEIRNKATKKEKKQKKVKQKAHLFGEIPKEDNSVVEQETDFDQASVASVDTYNSLLSDDAQLTFDENEKNNAEGIIEVTITKTEEEEEEEELRRNPLVPRSVIRSKLKRLNKFILGHTGRKIMVAWNLIDGRFQKSAHIKVEMVKEVGGLVIPVKKKAMTINSLTPILCSSKVGIIASELAFIYESFGISRSEALLSRKIALIKVLLGPDKGKGIRQAQKLLDELQILNQQVVLEKLISIDELKELAFPADPEKRAEAFKLLEIERQDIVNKMLDDKKKEEILKTQALIRKAKIISDFDDILKEIQFSRGIKLFFIYIYLIYCYYYKVH